MNSIFTLMLAIFIPFALVTGLANADELSSVEKLEFFEKQVRPLLVQHCHECHGIKKQEAALRLDTHAGLLKGSDSGPVVLAGNLDGSRLFEVLLYKDGGTQMPPKGKLTAEQIDIVRRWIQMGTPWPVESAPNDPIVAAKNHWSFQPVQRPAVPNTDVQNSIRGVENLEVASIALSPIDAFIAEALSNQRLTMSKPADRATLIRRAAFDLCGMPPTFETVQEFVADSSPDAFERMIDRLLASPMYGQRWGRYWLDLARYADSKGYVFTAEPRYPYSYTYRDYVVESLNADIPFDRFVVEQLAADVIVDAERPGRDPTGLQDPRLAALGFLTVGRRFLNNNHDIIDDRIDVVSRGLQGLTVGCARCHDHKFDPIPTADYYSMYGVFSSTNEPEELPIIGEPRNPAAYEAFLKELASREADVVSYETESVPKLMDEIRDVVGDVLQQIARQNPIWADTPVEFQAKNEPRAPIVQKWKEFLDRGTSQYQTVFGPWSQLAKISKTEEFLPEVSRLMDSWSIDSEAAKVNPLVRKAFVEQKPLTLIDVARLYGKLMNSVNTEWVELKKATPDVLQLPHSASEEVRQSLYGEGTPSRITLEEARPLFGRDVTNKITNLKRKADNLRVTAPGAPPRAMVVREGPVNEPVIFIRGNADRRGKPVPRQFLEIASPSDRLPFTKGSGRLELAESIIDSRNPLTARVIVNRIWQHHFGTGIVPTPSDFGTRGMPPSHPGLLDWLAAEIVGVEGNISRFPERWSFKHMHRLILTSAVYRQSSSEDPIARSIDPENRLLWRMPRQRLDFESLRDSLLDVAGRLDDSIGGQPFNDVMNPATTRRTLYTFINRNDLPGIFRAFDYADTDSTAAERPQTTVPQQSLFAMNSPFVHEQARQLAIRCQSVSQDPVRQIVTLYQCVVSRSPSNEELRVGVDFLKSAQTTLTDKLSSFERLAQVLLMTNEFVFID